MSELHYYHSEYAEQPRQESPVESVVVFKCNRNTVRGWDLGISDPRLAFLTSQDPVQLTKDLPRFSAIIIKVRIDALCSPCAGQTSHDTSLWLQQYPTMTRPDDWTGLPPSETRCEAEIAQTDCACTCLPLQAPSGGQLPLIT